MDHLYGMPGKIDEIKKMCDAHGALILVAMRTGIHSDFRF